MASLTLASTVLMGLILLLTAVAVHRLRHWRPDYRATLAGEGSTVSRPVIRGDTVWMLVFFVVTIGFTGAAIAIVSGASIGIEMPDSFWGQFGIAILPFLVLLTALVFGGLYATFRARGHGQAFATGAGIGIVGTLFVLGIAIRLILAA